MPVKINTVNTQVHAFDAASLLTEEARQDLTMRVVQEIRRQTAQDRHRQQDAEMNWQRRKSE